MVLYSRQELHLGQDEGSCLGCARAGGAFPGRGGNPHVVMEAAAVLWQQNNFITSSVLLKTAFTCSAAPFYCHV